MKRLNGEPMVHFHNAVIDFDIPLHQAEGVLAQNTPEKRKLALLELLQRSEIDRESVIHSDYVLGEFIKAIGIALAEQRGHELRQLAPAETIEPNTETA
jgi:hypothetical protein